MTDKISIMSPEVIDSSSENINTYEILADSSLRDATKNVQVSTGKIITYLEKDDIIQKLSLIKDKEHKMFFTLLWHTGLRVTEAIGIKKSSIDFENFTATVRWLKNRKAQYRTIPLHPDLLHLLEYYVGGFKADDELFKFSRKQAWNLSRKYFGVKTHAFRHSFAVHLVKNDTRIEIVSRLLGHKDIRNTMIYLEICPKDMGKELQKVSFR